MPRRIVALLIVLLASHWCRAEESNLWDYLGQRAEQLSATRASTPESLEDWQLQQGKTIERLTLALGLPARQSMKAEVVDIHSRDDLAFEEIVYHWADDTYASGTLIHASAESGRRPAVVIPSGWLGHYTFRAYRPLVEALACEGVAVFFIDDVRTGKRQAPRAGLYAAASAAGIPVAGIQVFDALRALDYLSTRPDIDAGKIGIAGVGQGAFQVYMAAAIEPRFQFAIAVKGTTSFDSLVQAAGPGRGPEDPSAYIPGLLEFTDVDHIAACLAPRPLLLADAMRSETWPAGGRMQVLRTLRTIYGQCNAESNLRSLAIRASGDDAATAAEVAAWVTEDALPALSAEATPPSSCGKPETVSLDILAYLQSKMTEQATVDKPKVIEWLQGMCQRDRSGSAESEVVATETVDDLLVEELSLAAASGYRCPAVLFRESTESSTPSPAVILSHGDRESAFAAQLNEYARQLAKAGYWVILPDHASVHRDSKQSLVGTDLPSFYGDDAASLYGPADAVGQSPLALRTLDNLAAFSYLADRSEIAANQITIAGCNAGALDACLAALLEPEIAGVAAVDVTTLRDWIATTAPAENRFFHLLPYLPNQLKYADWDQLLAAIAPRPLTIVRLKDGWPASGFDQVTATVESSYEAAGAAPCLTVLGPRDVTEQLEATTADAIQRQLIASARAFVPAPPRPGMVGNPQGLVSRNSRDSAAGIVWLIAEMDGYEQEFIDGGYRVKTWAMFNDNGVAQAGDVATPLIFRRQGEQYELIGIGKSRSNDGTGRQTFDFELQQGDDAVGAGCFFGWHTGDGAGTVNAGVIEYDTVADAKMLILTLDGQISNQKIELGQAYRQQAQFSRRYSITAQSEIPAEP